MPACLVYAAMEPMVSGLLGKHTNNSVTPPALTVPFGDRSEDAAQAGLEFMSSNDPPASASSLVKAVGAD